MIQVCLFDGWLVCQLSISPVCVSACLFVDVCSCLCAYITMCLCVDMSCVLITVLVCRSAWWLSVWRSVCVFLFLSIGLSVCLRAFVCLYLTLDWLSINSFTVGLIWLSIDSFVDFRPHATHVISQRYLWTRNALIPPGGCDVFFKSLLCKYRLSQQVTWALVSCVLCLVSHLMTYAIWCYGLGFMSCFCDSYRCIVLCRHVIFYAFLFHLRNLHT